MIFLISCIAGVFALFCRMPVRLRAAGMWTAWSRHVDCWFLLVRTFLQAEFWALVYNIFLLKNNEIGLYFWYSFVHFITNLIKSGSETGQTHLRIRSLSSAGIAVPKFDDNIDNNDNNMLPFWPY